MDNKIYTFEEAKEILKFVSEKKCEFRIKIQDNDNFNILMFITNCKDYNIDNGERYYLEYTIYYYDYAFSKQEDYGDVNEVISICEYYKSKEFQVCCEDWEDEKPAK